MTPSHQRETPHAHKAVGGFFLCLTLGIDFTRPANERAQQYGIPVALSNKCIRLLAGPINADLRELNALIRHVYTALVTDKPLGAREVVNMYRRMSLSNVIV